MKSNLTKKHLHHFSDYNDCTKKQKKNWPQFVLGVKIGEKGGLAEFNEDEALEQFAPLVTGKELLKKKLAS